ncbi:hypothetical protein SETIT_6G227300v2 [Setaria italica]|uniref:Uncharacterized protein n=1 Tax=Setaria italica TaxID=4555 RepID=K3YH00_SETIT|nr:UPF0481 protein At3g47200 [Setaria italica]RCV32050.1 hypothetical protein SETIT_6G227300v2 [Setaria italica]
MAMESPLMEPLLDSNDRAPAHVDTPGEHGDAAADESSAVVGNGTDAEESIEKKTVDGDDDGEEGDEMSASVQRRLDEIGGAGNEEEEEEEAGDDAEADEMAARMERRLAALPGKPHVSELYTIFRVAGPMRDRNRHLYEPQMVSLGPFHRGAGRHLDAMEAHKWRYLRDLLARGGGGKSGGATLADYARAARAMEPRARRRYAEPVALPPGEFAEMLLLDGCFVVEFFLKGEDREDDALIDASWAMQNVFNDLILLENQLPFFVLERFYNIATGGLGRDHFVTKVLVNYLTVDMGAARDAEPRRAPDGEIHHLLHLYYHWFLPPEDRPAGSDPAAAGSGSGKSEEDAFDEWISKPMEERVPLTLPSASDLKNAGVTIRAKKSPRSLVDVTFDPRGGVLEIPAVESYTNHVVFANLLAYEQSRGRWELQRLVSYVLLMESVVSAAHDVEILQRAGVLVKGGEDTAAFYAHLAGELCPPPEFVNNCYADLFRDVREHCGRSWNRHRAVLVHDYFSNPWTSMSAAAAVFLLVLTVVQTVYTVLPYYNPP